MSFLSTRVHLIWSTAQRKPLIQPDWQPRLHGYMSGVIENLKARVFIIGGVADHVHVYCSLPPTLAIAELAATIKSNSSRWVRETITADFGWQDGYAAFTMSKSADEDVMRYIATQETHHQRRSFPEELRAFLDKYEVPYDPKYVFA